MCVTLAKKTTMQCSPFVLDTAVLSINTTTTPPFGFFFPRGDVTPALGPFCFLCRATQETYSDVSCSAVFGGSLWLLSVAVRGMLFVSLPLRASVFVNVCVCDEILVCI